MSSSRRRPVLSTEIIDHFEEQVLLGKLAAGQRLPTEQELGERFAVSRTVVRDAMRTLAARGLIEVRQGVGITVASSRDTSLGEALAMMLMRSNITMGDVLDAREALETQLVPLAARNATVSDVDRLAQRFDRFASAVGRGNHPETQIAHLDFHLALVDAIDLPALELLLRPLGEVIVISSLPPRSNAPELWDVGLHQDILEAVRTGDERAAEDAMRAHFHAMSGPDYVSFRARLFRDDPAATDLYRRVVLSRDVT
jgi:GntR family transcriptional regulator, transcriptional repressor for pyruvate dehydrogenase complex